MLKATKPIEEFPFPPSGAPSTEQPSDNLLVVAKGGGVAFIGTAAARGLSYVYNLALIRTLGADDFGQFSLTLAIVTFIGLVSNIGLPQGIIRYGAIRAQTHGKNGVHQVTKAAIQVAIITGLILMVAVVLSSPAIASGIFHREELTPIFRVLALSIPFMSLQSMLLAATRSLKVMKYSTIVWIVQPMIALLLAIPLVYIGLGIMAAALAYVISHVCGAALALFYYIRLIPSENRDQEKYPLGKMMKFSIPLSMTEWMHFTNERTEIFFLGLLPGAVDISIYKIAWSLAGIETMLRLALEQILAPFSSDLTHRREPKKLEVLYKTTSKWGFTLALMIFGIYFLFGKELMGIFDPALTAGAWVLIALGAAQLVNEITGPCNTILIMSGRSDLTLLNTIVIFAIVITLDWLLIPKMGLIGAAIAGATSIILINIFRVVEVWLLLKIHPFKWSFFKPFIAAVIAGGVIYAGRTVIDSRSLIIPLVGSVLFWIAYLAIIWVLRLDADDMIVVDALKKKFPAIKRIIPEAHP